MRRARRLVLRAALLGVQVEGRGADEPIAPNTSKEGKALNRRVEVFLKPPAKGLVINN